MVLFNQNNKITAVDEACTEIFGYTKTDCLGKDIGVLLPSPFREYSKEWTKCTGREQKILEGQHQNGAVFPIAVSVSALSRSRGAAPGSGIQFIANIHPTNIDFATVNVTEEGLIVTANEKCERLFKKPFTEMLDTHIRTLVPSLEGREQLESARGRWQQLLGQDAKGAPLYVSVWAERESLGDAELWQVRIEDLTEDNELVFTLSHTGHVLQASRNFLHMLTGYTHADILGRPITELIDSQQLAQLLPTRVSQHAAAAAELDPDAKRRRVDAVEGDSTGYGPAVRMQVRHRDGSSHPFDVSTAAFHGDGGDRRYSMRMRRACDVSHGSGLGVVGPYVLKEKVESALYGGVFSAVHKDGGEVVAVKMQEKRLLSAEMVQRARNEYEIGKQLVHPNILRYYDFIDTAEHVAIVMEFCAQGTLYNYIRGRPQQRLGESEARVVFGQLVDAVSYCHAKNCMHGDIKLNNVLLRDNTAKLMDFNMSKASSFSGERSTFCGTPLYIAPELVLLKKYGGKGADVWSLGVCLYVMVTGHFPFDAIGVALSGEYTIPPHVSADCANLLQGMLKVDPDERLSVGEILAHPWLVRREQQPLPLPLPVPVPQ